jgi:hypothetical protein
MKRRNWVLLVAGAIGLSAFVFSRTIWGPASQAAASETSIHSDHAAIESDERSDAEKRYLANQPRHWRYVMLKH